MVIKEKKYYKNRKFSVLLILIAICISAINNASAQGNLIIFPKRVVFDGKKKVEKINLSNISKDSTTYSISFIQYKMTEFGGLKSIIEPDSGLYFASPYLRVYPRRVTLAPNETQTIKVQLIKNNNIEDGEYRSHLYFRAEKNERPLGQEAKANDSTSVSVKLEAIFGISIPTIINKGQSNTTASISDLEYSIDEEFNHFVNFKINRVGNMSTYGDLSVIYISSDNIYYEVAQISGVAVYTPGTIRKVKMKLKKPEGVYFSNGKFKVVYTVKDRKKVIAEAEKEI